MRALLIITLMALASPCHAKPVVVATSPGPERHFELVLSTDKDQPDYAKLEMKEGDFPKVWIRHRSSARVLAEFDFPADVESDLQPLREHIHAEWSPTCVAVIATERHGSRLLIYSLVGSNANPERFVEVKFPNVGELIRQAVPKVKEFRARWHTDFQGWPGKNLVMFSSGCSDRTSESSAVYSFTFDVTDPLAPILRRMEHMPDY